MRYVEAGRKSLRLAQERRNRPAAGRKPARGLKSPPRAARPARAGIPAMRVPHWTPWVGSAATVRVASLVGGGMDVAKAADLAGLLIEDA